MKGVSSKFVNGKLVYIDRVDTVYTYREALTAYKRPTIFACIALDILAADRLFEKKFGKPPWKYVNCGFVNRYVYL